MSSRWPRKITAGIAIYLLTITLLLMVQAAIFHFVLANPQKIKNVLNNSAVYNSFVEVSLNELSKNPDDLTSTIPLGDPGIQKAVQNAFPPQLLRSNTEKLIDGTYDWLHGKTERAEFTLDFSKPKNNLAKEVGGYAQRRAAKLPPCGLQDIPRQIDAFKINCLPPGISPKQVGASVTSDLKSDQNFLPETKITPETLFEDSVQSSPFDQKDLPNQFQLMNNLLWIFIATAFVLVATTILVSENKRSAVKRICKSLLAVGIFSVLTPLLLNFFVDRIASSGLFDSDISSKLVLPIFEEFISAVSVVYFVIGVLFILIAAAGLVWVKRQNDQATSPPTPLNFHKK